MSLLTQRYGFNRLVIAFSAPDQHGVYGLYDAADTCIYYGRAAGTDVTIKSRLLDHLNGDDGPCTQGAAFFRFEVTLFAANRERQLLNGHQQTYGELPRCNSRIG